MDTTVIESFFDPSLIQSETVTVRRKKYTLYEISSDVWHHHVARFKDELPKEDNNKKEREINHEILDWMYRLVASSSLSPELCPENISDRLSEVRKLPETMLIELYHAACRVNGLDKGNSQGADSTTD